MTVVEQRHGITKGDVREHWKEEMGKVVLAMLILLFAQLVLVVPAWIFGNLALEILIQALGFSIFWLWCRLMFCLYKYAKV